MGFELNDSISYQTNLHNESQEYKLEDQISETPFSLDAFPTCTTTPSRTNITYSIIQNEQKEIPSWISFNQNTGKYEGTPPKVYYDTDYSFILSSSWTTSPSGNSQQVVKITTKPSTEATATSAAATTAASAGGGFALSLAFLNGGSPAGLYMIIHLIQMILLMMLIDPFVPTSIREYSSSQSIALINFDFISAPSVPYLNKPAEWMHTDQVDVNMEALGMGSGSTFVNNFSFFAILTLILLLHFMLLFV